MAPQITRRKFIFSIITSVAAISVSRCASEDAIQKPPATPAPATPTVETISTPTSTPTIDLEAEAFSDILRKKFDYLNLDEAGLMVFVQEFQAKAGQKILELRKNNLAQFEYEVGTQFLMSTDFFWNDADETRLIKYRAYYDRSKPCNNPFARFD